MTLKQVPASCCKSNLTDCSSANPVAVSEIWTEDCFVVGLSFVQEHAVYLAGVALGISSLMVGGMASSIHMIFVKPHHSQDMCPLCIQCDQSGPPVDLVLTLSAAGGPLLWLPTAHAG